MLSRVRTVTKPEKIDDYFEDYRKSFTWPDANGSETFRRFFPFYQPAIDVLRAVSYNLTTLRSAVHFMHQTLKTQRKAKSNELITLWQMFDDVVSYEEDPPGRPRASRQFARSTRRVESLRGGATHHRAGHQGAAEGLRHTLRKDPEDALFVPRRQMQPNGLSSKRS